MGVTGRKAKTVVRKLLAFMCALAMVMSMNIAVFAAEQPSDSGKDGNSIETSAPEENVISDGQEDFTEEPAQTDSYTEQITEDQTDPVEPVAEAVASVDGQEYSTLEEAFDNVVAESRVTVLQDCTITSTITLGVEAVLDLNGKTVTKETANMVDKGFYVYNNGNLTIIDSSAEQSGAMVTEQSGVLIGVYGGTFTLESGALKAVTAITLARHGDAARNGDEAQDAKVYIKGGTITAHTGVTNNNSEYNGTVEITGGVINAENDALNGYNFTISGGEITSRFVFGVPSALDRDLNNLINGGMIKADFIQNLSVENHVNTVITGGSFSANSVEPASFRGRVDACVPEGYQVFDNEDGTIFHVEKLIASIGNEVYTSLEDAAAAAGQDETVKLLSDVELENTLAVESGKDFILDLNGKTITTAGAHSTMLVEGILKIEDNSAEKTGSINSAEYTGTAVSVQNGGNLTLGEGRLVSEKGTAVYVTGNLNPEGSADTEAVASTFNMEGGQVHSREYGIGIGGRGAVLNVSGGTVEAEDNAVIGGNGTNSSSAYYGGTEINITGGTLNGNIVSEGYIACGIYHPQAGELNISAGTINVNSGVGILMRGGQLNMTGGTVIASGTVSGKVGDSNIVQNCYGILVDGNSAYYDYENCTAEISGGAVVKAADGVEALMNVPAEDQGKIRVTGGTFSSDVTAYCADGFESVMNGSGDYAVQKKEGYYNVAEYKGEKEESEWTYPDKDGMIFAGWYTDDTCETPYTETDGYAYARFVDEKVLTVKGQLPADTTAESQSTTIRFVSTVDSEEYSAVGFDIAYEYKGETYTASWEGTDVFKRLYKIGQDGVYLETSPKEFSDSSEYFFTYNLTGIPNDAFDVQFTVTPHWKTQDGTTVYGITRNDLSVQKGIGGGESSVFSE